MMVVKLEVNLKTLKGSMQKIGSFDCFIPSLSKAGGVKEINLKVTLLG